MTVVACLELAVLLAAVFLLTRHHSTQEKAWTEERRELVNRIQRPDHVPLRVPEAFTLPDPEPDELHLVGSIADPNPEEPDG